MSKQKKEVQTKEMISGPADLRRPVDETIAQQREDALGDVVGVRRAPRHRCAAQHGEQQVVHRVAAERRVVRAKDALQREVVKRRRAEHQIAETDHAARELDVVRAPRHHRRVLVSNDGGEVAAAAVPLPSADNRRGQKEE